MITVAGESIVDVVHYPDGRVQRSPGGSPANVAVGLARLGRDVQLLTHFGDDPDGQMLAAAFSHDGVQVHGAGTGTTSTATAHLDERGIARYTFDLVAAPARHETAPLTGQCLHTGSLAALAPANTAATSRLLQRARGKMTVSFDPNCRPELMGEAARAQAVVHELLPLCDVVKVSDEDLAWLHPGQDTDAVARDWLQRGPALVVVTRGGEGCFALNDAGRVEAAAKFVRVVDTVGAGDSFTAALLDALSRAGALGAAASSRIQRLSAADLDAVLRWAVTAAGITCGRSGANPPLRADMHGTGAALT